MTWRDRAACLGLDPDLFFPENSDRHYPLQARQACAACPVKVECLNFAKDHNIPVGMWGGTTPEQRRRRGTQRSLRNQYTLGHRLPVEPFLTAYRLRYPRTERHDIRPRLRQITHTFGYTDRLLDHLLNGDLKGANAGWLHALAQACGFSDLWKEAHV